MKQEKPKNGSDMTTIRISKATKDRLDQLGTVKDTYDDVLMMVLDNFELKKVSDYIKGGS